MEKLSKQNYLSLEEFRIQRRCELLERHAGKYKAVPSIENHLLPFECELAKKSKNYFELLDRIEFLYVEPENLEYKKLTQKDFQEACKLFFSDKKKGTDYFQNVKKTISKHIKKITGQTLSTWTRGPHSQDALKTGYLLYQLHIAIPSGLEIITKSGDPRFAEVELFTGHHKPKNSNEIAENDQVIMLSTWLKELFSKALFHRSEIERGMLKNLDLIFTGYHCVFKFIYNGRKKEEADNLFAEIFNSVVGKINKVPDEVLSIKLMRTWQENVKYHNVSCYLSERVVNSFLKANEVQQFHTDSKITLSSKDEELLRLGARLFSWILFQGAFKYTFKVFTESEKLEMIALARQREDKIYYCLRSDLENQISLIAKGIGEDSKKTSIKNTLKLLVENNRKILNQPFDIFVVLNIDNNCETHYRYLYLRVVHFCDHGDISPEDFIRMNKDHIESNNKQVKWVYDYVNSMTLDELYHDIQRVNRIMSKLVGGDFTLLAPASELKY